MGVHFNLLTLLLFALFTLSISDNVFWSLNCGESEFYTDPENFIVWTPDETLVSNGVAQVVQSSYSASPVLDSLRVFTSRKKNCYSTPVEKGEKYLVRVSFLYGNYDQKSSPPTFDLHFDGNFWATVETSISEPVVYEATYVAKGAAISVCVAQTQPNQFPFISALEVRSVDSQVYSDVDESRALFLVERLSLGATQTIRYPNDLYDRIWVPTLGGPNSKKVTNDALFINTTSMDNPPSQILENAITIDDTETTLNLITVHPSPTPIYINMYFSEVTNLDSTQNRTFVVYKNNETSLIPITPPYGSVEEYNINNYTVDSNTNISLVSIGDSNLPPLINAMEVLTIGGVLTDGTDNNDVEGLSLLQTTFDVLGGWSGDPCLPAPYSWDWVNCSYGATPRITSLFLDSFELSGSLPDISSMDALEIIDLHNNSLIGTIPSSLGTMSNLKELNLADNQLSGTIPTSLSKNNKLKLTVSGNPSLCTSDKPCSSSSGDVDSSSGGTTTTSTKSNKLPVILGTTIPSFIVVWAIAGVFIILRRKRRTGKPNTHVAPGHTVGGANGTSNEMHRIGEEIMNEVAENVTQTVVQSVFGSPSPLLNT